MKGGRKNLKRAARDGNLILQDGQSIMQVVSLRGSNLIEVMDERGDKLLALFPAKFQKSLWIKRGSFVVVDETGKEKALEAGNKVACIVSQVLFREQICSLEKSLNWPEVFKSESLRNSKISSSQQEDNLHENISQEEENELNSSDDNAFPPLEANMNRIRPNISQEEENELNSSDEDGLPPLEANMNRIRPLEIQSDSDDAGSDTD